MRKFYKILTLILTLAAILTAFTVVALADGESTKPPIEATYGQTFDSYSEGAFLNDSYKARNGLAVLQVQDNGNKYVLTKPNDTEYADSSSTNWHNPQWDVYTTQYGSIVDYPYFLVELDVTTTNGKYGDFACYPRLFGTSNSRSSFVTNNAFKNLGLSTTPYEWNHVSIVVEYKGDGKFTTYRYVNGNQIGNPVDADLSGTDLFKNDPLKDIKLSSMKLYPYANGSVCMDNFYVTYFPVGYHGGNIGDIANYRYNYGKGYEFPYTYTKAWVGDTAYDDLGEAMAAAADGVTVKLTENAKEALIIDKNIILDTNVYDANGNATGSFYTYEYKTS